MNHGVVPSQWSRAAPMPKNSATVSATSMPRPTVGSDDLLARGFVGRSFIGIDDRPRGGRLLVNAGTSYCGSYHSCNSLAGQVGGFRDDGSMTIDETRSAFRA